MKEDARMREGDRQTSVSPDYWRVQSSIVMPGILLKCAVFAVISMQSCARAMAAMRQSEPPIRRIEGVKELNARSDSAVYTLLTLDWTGADPADYS